EEVKKGTDVGKKTKKTAKDDAKVEEKPVVKTDEIPTEQQLAQDDYVLYAALNVLKGAAFWQAKP
ncbi:MAG TPA: hypothetical protein PKU92_00560, partial [Agitococcus sp.]|nr:hypothetical protein [Agitococcus sp.]